MRHKQLTLLLWACIIGMTIISFIPPSLALANIYLYPSLLTAEPGESFTVNVRISGAVDVFGWEFELGWNASVLDFIKVEEGTFLKGIEQIDTAMVNKTYQDQVGNDTISVGATRLGYVTGVDGSGTLATVTFTAEVKGETTLDLFETHLADSRPTPFPIEHTTTDGFFTNVAGFPQARFTYAPTLPKINETIVFDASTSSDPDGTIERYLWDFGDGEYANETDPLTSHAFDEGGRYNVALTVIDNDDFNTTITEEVKVRFAHDVAVTVVSLSHETATAGDTVTITVTVRNVGVESETFTVRVYYDDTEAAAAQTVSDLAAGLNRTLTFYWETAEVEPDEYRIKAVAESVPSEGYTADNTKLGSTITVEAAAEFPWVFTIGGIVGVAAVVIAGVYLLRRRGKGAT